MCASIRRKYFAGENMTKENIRQSFEDCRQTSKIIYALLVIMVLTIDPFPCEKNYR